MAFGLPKLILRTKIGKRNKKFLRKDHLIKTIFIVSLLIVLLTDLFAFYVFSVGLVLVNLVIFFYRKDLIKPGLVSGLIFAILYFLSWALVEFLVPGFISGSWTIKNMHGLFIFRVPIEEVYGAFLFGTLWSNLYLYVKKLTLV